MQEWVDICVARVKAELGIPPVYIERTGIVAYDFLWADHIIDNTFREFDLSGIVPVGASAVNIHWKGLANPVGAQSVAYCRQHGAPDALATCKLRPQVTNREFAALFVVGLTSSRIVEYRVIVAGNFQDLNFTVKGWWL